MDIRDQYRERAIQFAKDWNTEVSEHNLDIMVSIMATRDKTSYEGGSFVQAVVANDLRQAVARADDDNLRVIKLLAMCRYNCFL